MASTTPRNNKSGSGHFFFESDRRALTILRPGTPPPASTTPPASPPLLPPLLNPLAPATKARVPPPLNVCRDDPPPAPKANPAAGAAGVPKPGADATALGAPNANAPPLVDGEVLMPVATRPENVKDHHLALVMNIIFWQVHFNYSISHAQVRSTPALSNRPPLENDFNSFEHTPALEAVEPLTDDEQPKLNPPTAPGAATVELLSPKLKTLPAPEDAPTPGVTPPLGCTNPNAQAPAPGVLLAPPKVKALELPKPDEAGGGALGMSSPSIIPSAEELKPALACMHTKSVRDYSMQEHTNTNFS